MLEDPPCTITLLSATLDQIVIAEAFVAAEGPSLCVYVTLEESECVPSLVFLAVMDHPFVVACVYVRTKEGEEEEEEE